MIRQIKILKQRNVLQNMFSILIHISFRTPLMFRDTFGILEKQIALSIGKFTYTYNIYYCVLLTNKYCVLGLVRRKFLFDISELYR